MKDAEVRWTERIIALETNKVKVEMRSETDKLDTNDSVKGL